MKHFNNMSSSFHSQCIISYNALSHTNCGRIDYYDENGDGKFMRLVIENEFNENNIHLEFNRNNVKEESETYSREIKIFNVLKYCYKYDIPPPQNANSNTSNNALQTSKKS